MTGIISTLKVKERRMRTMAEGSLTVAVDLAERLVEESGLSFREAYVLVAALVRDTLDKEKRLQELMPAAIEEASLSILGKRVKVDEELIREVTDPRSILLRRRSQGSPQPMEAERMLRERRRQLKEDKAILEKRRSTVFAAKRLLRKTVECYL